MTWVLVFAPVGVALLALGVIGWGVFAPRARLFGPVQARLPQRAIAAREVALTFDDGPLPGSTDRILDTLAEHGVRATFFVIGRYAATHPELARRIVDEGHAIGNHTLDHARTGLFRSQTYWNDQIAQAQDSIEQATGVRPFLFRAPMGFKAPTLMRALRPHGLRVVAWSRRGFDAGLGSRESVLRAARSMRPGDVLLLHDGRDPASRRTGTGTAQALPELLQILRGRDLHPVRLDAE